MINLPDYKKIHCIGIGGIGLSAVAEILMARGYDISGSDMRESDMTAKLAHDGAQIYIGHKAENVEGKDLIIYSSLRSAWKTRKLAKAKELGIPAVTRAQALGALMAEYDSSIAISGNSWENDNDIHGFADLKKCTQGANDPGRRQSAGNQRKCLCRAE